MSVGDTVVANINKDINEMLDECKAEGLKDSVLPKYNCPYCSVLVLSDSFEMGHCKACNKKIAYSSKTLRLLKELPITKCVFCDAIFDGVMDGKSCPCCGWGKITSIQTITSLNSSDVFILDGGTDRHIFQWNGSKAPPQLRWKARDIISRVDQYERYGRSIIKSVEEGHEEDDDDDDEEGEDGAFYFLDYLMEQTGDIPTKGDPIEDDIIVYRSTDDPKAPIGKVREGAESGPLTREILQTGRACILDAETEIFVWLGKGCGKVKAGTLPIGTMAIQVGKRLKGIDRDEFTSLTIVHEGSEPTYFVMKFPGWGDQLFKQLHEDYAMAALRRERIAPPPVSPFVLDPEKLLAPPVIPKPEMPDDASGTVEVWTIEDGRPTFAKLPHEERGEFYASDCYLVLYTYHDTENRMKQSYVIYWWEGRQASNRWFPAFLYGFYPVLERKIIRAGGSPPEIHKVKEQYEPAHFMELFYGQLIVHSGHRPKSAEERANKPVQLHHVHRTTPIYTHAIEVSPEPGSLNSFDAFILRTPEKLFLWYGKDMGYDDSEPVLEILSQLEDDRSVVECYEGDEDPDFWNLLGGWKEYMCNDKFAKKYSKRKPRLYTFYYEAGALTVSEIPRFCQNSVLQRDRSAFMFDTFYDVYVWAGNQASETLASQALSLARQYVKYVAAKRLIVVGIHAFSIGDELPKDVTRHFHTWVPPKATFVDPEIARNEKLKETIFQLYKTKALEEIKKQEEEFETKEEKRKKLKRVDLSIEFKHKFPELADSLSRMEKKEARQERKFMEAFKKSLDIELEGETAEDPNTSDSEVESEEEKEEDNWEYDKMERVVEEEDKKEKTAADKFMERFEKSTRMAKIYGTRHS